MARPGPEPRYRVEFAPSAQRQFRDLPRPVQERIVPRIRALAEQPRPRGAEKLAGTTDQYRIRVGDYRVIYAIRDDRLLILLLRFGHRRDIYRKR